MMTDARKLSPNGKCHDCGRAVSGERRVCGLCAARRAEATTQTSNALRLMRYRAERDARLGRGREGENGMIGAQEKSGPGGAGNTGPGPDPHDRDDRKEG